MDVSSLGSLSNTPRAKAETSPETAKTNQTSSNAIQIQLSEGTQTSTVPPVQSPSDLAGEEGNSVTHENSSSTNKQGSATDPESGTQLDVVA